jgi:hypothetical protein
MGQHQPKGCAVISERCSVESSAKHDSSRRPSSSGIVAAYPSSPRTPRWPVPARGRARGMITSSQKGPKRSPRPAQADGALCRYAMHIGHEFRANDEDFVEGQLDRLLHVAVDPQREVA